VLQTPGVVRGRESQKRRLPSGELEQRRTHVRRLSQRRADLQRHSFVLPYIVAMCDTSPSTSEAGVPGAFSGETITRRRAMTVAAQAAGALAGAAIGLPALGFALGPVFRRVPAIWQSLGPLADIPRDTYAMRVVTETPGIGEAGQTTVFLRRRDPAVD